MITVIRNKKIERLTSDKPMISLVPSASVRFPIFIQHNEIETHEKF